MKKKNDKSLKQFFDIQKIKDKVINKLYDFFKIKNLLFLDESGISGCKISEGSLIKNEFDISKINQCLISDTLLEIKLITIPAVSRSLLKNIILNTVKKQTVKIPSDNDIDYLILEKEDKKYHILVFIKRFKDQEDKKNIRYFSVYHILQNFIKDPFFNHDSSFIIKHHKEWFLYSFKERILKKWSIYYDEDISSLKKKNIYLLNLFDEKADNKYFSSIPKDKLNHALSTINKKIFIKKGEKSLKNILLKSGFAAACLIIILLNLNRFFLKSDLKKLEDESGKLKALYDKEVSSRGITDELYNKYIALIKRKSNVNEFFYYLYLTCNDNVEIQRINYNNGKFAVSGFCRDDSKLENSFRKINLYQNVNFNFSRTSNAIKFNIDGVFTGEQ